MRYRVIARGETFGPIDEQAEARFANHKRAENYAITLIDEGYGLVSILEDGEILVQWKHGQVVPQDEVRNPITGVPRQR